MKKAQNYKNSIGSIEDKRLSAATIDGAFVFGLYIHPPLWNMTPATVKKRKVTAEEFMNYDGKYILIQKITDHCSWTSHIAPEVKDLWAIFKLFEGIYDDVPQDINIKSLKPACIFDGTALKTYFICESSMFYFKKRGYQVIGNYEFDAFPVDPNDITETWSVAANVYLGINRPWYNADSLLISAMRN